MEKAELLALRTYVLDLVNVLFDDDRATGIETRLPAPPSMVQTAEPLFHRFDGTRLSGFALDGSFEISAVLSLDWSGGDFMDRYDVCTAYVTPTDLPEHRGARLSMNGQPGQRTTALTVEAETLRNPPTAPASQKKATKEPPAASTAEVLGTAEETSGPLIGGIEPVPALNVAGLISEQDHRQIEVLRSFEDFAEVSVYRAADAGTIAFGMPPSFEPVIDIGVDAMTIGRMIDAPELGYADPWGCLFGWTMAGSTLMEIEVNLLAVVRRSVTQRRLDLVERNDDAALELWTERALELQELMQWTEFSRSGVDGLGWNAKRRKPALAPTGTKWRRDAAGNGVLAATASWGVETVRKPRNVDAALSIAPTLAPAASLHVLREALVMANAKNEPAAASIIYQAMVSPLEQLGRSTIAVRSDALANR